MVQIFIERVISVYRSSFVLHILRNEHILKLHNACVRILSGPIIVNQLSLTYVFRNVTLTFSPTSYDISDRCC